MTEFGVAYVPGTWDLFHYGHVRLLERAHDLARFLIVGVNTDESVKIHKGRHPVLPLKYRLAVVSACRYVSSAEARDFPIDVDHIRSLGAEALFLGDDWEHRFLEGLEEAKLKLVVRYLSYTKEISTTAIRERIKEDQHGNVWRVGR